MYGPEATLITEATKCAIDLSSSGEEAGDGEEMSEEEISGEEGEMSGEEGEMSGDEISGEEGEISGEEGEISGEEGEISGEEGEMSGEEGEMSGDEISGDEGEISGEEGELMSGDDIPCNICNHPEEVLNVPNVRLGYNTNYACQAAIVSKMLIY